MTTATCEPGYEPVAFEDVRSILEYLMVDHEVKCEEYGEFIDGFIDEFPHYADPDCGPFDYRLMGERLYSFIESRYEAGWHRCMTCGFLTTETRLDRWSTSHPVCEDCPIS